VIRQPIWEPYGIYRKLTGRKKDEQMQSAFNEAEKAPSLAQNTAVFVRSNFFIPDARKFWIKPAARFLRRWLRDNPVDVMATNGTPHSCHLIGLKLKRELPDLPWLADFRDPWTGIDYFSQLKLVPRASSPTATSRSSFPSPLPRMNALRCTTPACSVRTVTTPHCGPLSSHW